MAATPDDSSMLNQLGANAEPVAKN